jgi:CRP-like cAMP-binding protein
VENFIRYLQRQFTISETDIQKIREVCRVKKLRRKQYLLQEGDIWRYNAFVLKGLLRTYIVDEKGGEHYIQFSPEDWWAGDRESYIYEKPAKYNVDAYEDSEVVLITKDDMQMLYAQIPALNLFMLNLLERSLIALRNRVHSNISFTAEEKYLEFLKTYPDLSNRLPQHMVASFLGITPETLSRIRNQIAKK